MPNHVVGLPYEVFLLKSACSDEGGVRLADATVKICSGEQCFGGWKQVLFLGYR